jgi:hypothetical protein
VIRTEIFPLVQADMEARIAKGAKQYGERLASRNGRDALWDAYEEAMDLCMYLRQAIAERDSCISQSRQPATPCIYPHCNCPIQPVSNADCGGQS